MNGVPAHCELKPSQLSLEIILANFFQQVDDFRICLDHDFLPEIAIFYPAEQISLR